jgi:hypothetical protein
MFKEYPMLFEWKEDGKSEDYCDSLSDSLQSWALKQTGFLKNMEIELIAGLREKVCFSCPHHEEFGFDNSDEVERYETIIAKVTQGKSLKRKKLNACNHCKMDCRVLVYTKELPNVDIPYCWIGRDLSDFAD